MPWLSSTELANYLKLPTNAQNSAAMDEDCATAEAWVRERLRPQYRTDPPDAETLRVATMWAAQLYRHRQNPEGVTAVGDFGLTRTDRDLSRQARSLLAHRYEDGFS